VLQKIYVFPCTNLYHLFIETQEVSYLVTTNYENSAAFPCKSLELPLVLRILSFTTICTSLMFLIQLYAETLDFKAS